MSLSPHAEMSKMSRRHRAEVTADRLGDDYQRYYDKLSDSERNAIGTVRHALQEIAEGNR